MHGFETALSVQAQGLEFAINALGPLPWADFFVNPRRLRGSDFLMRWSQGVWSEKRLIEAVNQTERYYALPYGPSGTAPGDDVQALEAYFDRLQAAGLGRLKRPDLLIFRKSDKKVVSDAVRKLGGTRELPFTSEEDRRMAELLARAILAVECENSLWKASQMPDYGAELKPMRRLDGKPGLKKSAVLPTVILKEEDRVPLGEWQKRWPVPIHIWHVFYDMAFGLALKTAEALIKGERVDPIEQVFQAPGGATTKKVIYKVYYHYAYPLAQAREEPKLVAEYIIDKNGHILPFVRFEGGDMQISAQALRVLDQACE